MSNEQFVNANIGITNITEKEEIRSTMMKTFIELADKLKAHCGPYSGTAILTNPNDPLAEPVFTKDGINIVRAMMYAAPIQDFVRKQLAYMGSRVERSAGDGTTSTMIIMAYTMASLIDFISSTKSSYSTNDMATTWRCLVDKINAKYDKYREYTAAIGDPETIKFVAASQAYTSSHGDKELAKCIGELFSNTPKEVWDTLSVTKAMYESEERYKVTINHAQYSLDNARLFPNDKCNADLGTSLKLDDACCLVQDTVSIGDDLQTPLVKYIDACIKEGKQLIVVCSDHLDNATRQHYEDLFIEYPRHNVIFVLVPQEDARLNDVAALMAIRYESVKNVAYSDPETCYKALLKRQAESPDTFATDTAVNNATIGSLKDCYPFFNANVSYVGSTFRFLTGLFDDNGSGLNPYYKNEEHKEFNEFIEGIRAIIKREVSDVTRSNTRVIKSFIRVLHKLIATNDVVFTVGGAAYDNAAAQDVAMDALLATKCSLTKGFVAGRCVTLRQILTDLLSEQDNPENKFKSLKINELYAAFIKALISGIEEVDKALEDSVGLADSLMKALEYKYAPADFTRLDDPSYEIPSSLFEAISSKKEYCILEPIETDMTFIKRFGEIGLKFLTANRVITAGYMSEDKGVKNVK